jgi:hypothetical protein
LVIERFHDDWKQGSLAVAKDVVGGAANHDFVGTPENRR